MRSNPTDLARVRQALRDRIDTIERGSMPMVPAVPTGWSVVDAALHGGLRRGAVHEWLGICDANASPRAAWVPPLLLLTHLARRAAGVPDLSAPGWTVWIGLRVWPGVHALRNPAFVARSLVVDAPSAVERLWAIDAALRCTGLVVIADGSALNTASTRRLQLAAESGGSVGLIARPAHELGSISAAATRWSVSRSLAPGEEPRWTVKLVRCKGPRAGAAEVEVDVERDGSGAVVAVPSHVADRPGAARLAS